MWYKYNQFLNFSFKDNTIREAHECQEHGNGIIYVCICGIVMHGSRRKAAHDEWIVTPHPAISNFIDNYNWTHELNYEFRHDRHIMVMGDGERNLNLLRPASYRDYVVKSFFETNICFLRSNQLVVLEKLFRNNRENYVFDFDERLL